MIGMAVSGAEMYLYSESTICQRLHYGFTKGGSGREYAYKGMYNSDSINSGRLLGTDRGDQSISYGDMCEASGRSSQGVGCSTKATADYASAEGAGSVASGMASHAENSSRASGDRAHAEGWTNVASGEYSHVEGLLTEASGAASHAQGKQTKATKECCSAAGNNTEATNENSHACGHYNAAMTEGGNQRNTTGTAFVVGNGTGDNEKSNAFTVNFDGTVSASGAISGKAAADYAEYFEWEDSNPDFEDRAGLFVTLEGDMIRTAGPGDGYILGIVSGAPFVLGNGDCDTWNGMFLRDEFGRVMYERAPKIEREVVADKEGRFVELKETPVLDAEGNPLYMGMRPRINPDYNPAEPYVRRSDRPEWSPVGMLGVLAVRQDGSCKVNGYCTCGEGGVAIACGREAENAYRVIKVLSDSVAKVVFR